MFDFNGKTALVTGGSRGIGRAIALALAKGGASVALNYAGNEAAADGGARARAAGGRAEGEALPLRRRRPGRVHRGGRGRSWRSSAALHVLVNNAGIAVDQLVMRVKDEDWNRTARQVNLTGAFNLIRAVARPMMKASGGAIVNLTSVVGEMGNAGQAAYAATKAGLIGLTKSVARELASRNIRVNAVAPGFIDTDMTAALPEAAKAKMQELIPLARLGTAEDVANAVAFLASDQASYVTGEVLRVNGGMYM